MKEIEVKARVTDKAGLLSKLTDLGCTFSEPITQYDRIFIPIGSTIPAKPGVNVFRVREQSGKYILTLKQTVKNQLDCIERELNIDNQEEMIEIFKLLGFTEVSQVRKQRQKSIYNGLEICLDTVEGLGDFIEVEKMSSDPDLDGETIQNELFSFLETLGIKKEDQIFVGYDVLAAQLNSKWNPI